MSVPDSDQNWWAQALAATLASLSADPRGLTAAEAGRRLAKRHDALSLRTLRGQGISPEKIRAGWAAKD